MIKEWIELRNYIDGWVNENTNKINLGTMGYWQAYRNIQKKMIELENNLNVRSLTEAGY